MLPGRPCARLLHYNLMCIYSEINPSRFSRTLRNVHIRLQPYNHSETDGKSIFFHQQQIVILATISRQLCLWHVQLGQDRRLPPPHGDCLCLRSLARHPQAPPPQKKMFCRLQKVYNPSSFCQKTGTGYWPSGGCRMPLEDTTCGLPDSWEGFGGWVAVARSDNSAAGSAPNGLAGLPPGGIWFHWVNGRDSTVSRDITILRSSHNTLIFR